MDAPPTAAQPNRDIFDEEAYLALHPDVASAVDRGIVGSGWQHFLLHGQREGRAWIAQPDRLAGVSREIAAGDEMFSGNLEHYWDVGASARRCVAAALASAGRPPASVARVLDLPCGHGRVLRFLRAMFPHADLTACDLNQDGVEFCARTFGARPVVSHSEVSRIELPGNFDLIWCGSLLTHLPRVRCEEFLRRFDRSLAPGGILVVTLHGRRYLEESGPALQLSNLDAAQTAELKAGYQRDGFAYVDYREQTGYGFSVVHPAFALTHFLPCGHWRLLTYQENGWDRRQDVLGLQKLA